MGFISNIGASNISLVEQFSSVLTTGGFNTFLGDHCEAAVASQDHGIALGSYAVCSANECSITPYVDTLGIYVLSSTGDLRKRFAITASNVDNTDATRKYKATLSAYDTAKRDVLELNGDGTYGQLGILNGLSNGQKVQVLALTELVTVAAAATSASTIQIPAGAVVLAVSARVTVAIPTATVFTVTGTGDATVFNTVDVPVAINTVNKGVKSCPYYNPTAQTLTLTPDQTPASAVGRVRLTCHYYLVTAPTS